MSARSTGTNARLKEGAKVAQLWKTGRIEKFHALADSLLEGGRQDALDTALVAASVAGGKDMAGQMAAAIRSIAEMAYSPLPAGGICAMDLFAVAVICGPGEEPCGSSFATTLEASGMFPAAVRIRMAQGCYEAEALARLSACEVREVLRSLSHGLPLPHLGRHPGPGGTAETVLIGLALLDCAAGTPDDGDEVSILQDDNAEMEACYESWRTMACGPSGNGAQSVLDVIRPCPPSGLALERRLHLERLQSEAENAKASPWSDRRRLH